MMIHQKIHKSKDQSLFIQPNKKMTVSKVMELQQTFGKQKDVEVDIQTKLIESCLGDLVDKKQKTIISAYTSIKQQLRVQKKSVQNEENLNKKNLSLFYSRKDYGRQSYFSGGSCRLCSEVSFIEKQELIYQHLTQMRESVEDLKFQLISLKAYYEDYLEFQKMKMMDILTQSTQMIIQSVQKIILEEKSSLINQLSYYKKLSLQKQGQLQYLQKKLHAQKNERIKPSFEINQQKNIFEEKNMMGTKKIWSDREQGRINTSLSEKRKQSGLQKSNQKARNKSLNEIEMMKGKIQKMKSILQSEPESSLKTKV